MNLLWKVEKKHNNINIQTQLKIVEKYSLCSKYYIINVREKQIFLYANLCYGYGSKTALCRVCFQFLFFIFEEEKRKEPMRDLNIKRHTIYVFVISCSGIFYFNFNILFVFHYQ